MRLCVEDVRLAHTWTSRQATSLTTVTRAVSLFSFTDFVKLYVRSSDNTTHCSCLCLTCSAM
jgi:hypothetical protein